METLRNGFIMLLREYGRRYKERDLFSVGDRFKGRTDGYLRLPVTDITAKQTVHRAFSFHILFNFLNGSELIICFLIRESRLELTLHFMIRRERIAFACFAFRIKLNQIIGNILNGVFNFFLHPFPFTAAQFIKLRFFSFRADVLLHLVDLFYRDVQLITALVMNVEVIFMNALDFKCFDPQILTDPVVDVDDIVTDLKLRIAFDPFGICQLLLSRLLLDSVFEQLFLCNDGQLHQRQFKTGLQLAFHDIDLSLDKRFGAVRFGGFNFVISQHGRQSVSSVLICA